jgi:hypothetical protein
VTPTAPNTRPDRAKARGERWNACPHNWRDVRRFPTRHRCQACGALVAERTPAGWRQCVSGKWFLVTPLAHPRERYPKLAALVDQGQGYVAAHLEGPHGAGYALWMYDMIRGKSYGLGRLYAAPHGGPNFQRPERWTHEYRLHPDGYLWSPMLSEG